jgi:hypothetical protein
MVLNSNGYGITRTNTAHTYTHTYSLTSCSRYINRLQPKGHSVVLQLCHNGVTVM